MKVKAVSASDAVLDMLLSQKDMGQKHGMNDLLSNLQGKGSAQESRRVRKKWKKTGGTMT